MFSKKVNQQQVLGVYRANQAKSIENVTETIKRLCRAFCILVHTPPFPEPLWQIKKRGRVGEKTLKG